GAGRRTSGSRRMVAGGGGDCQARGADLCRNGGQKSSSRRAKKPAGSPRGPGDYGEGLPLRELEALAGALAAVLLSLLHAAVAGQVAGVAELLGHVRLPFGLLAVGGRLAAQAEHVLQRAGHALAARAALAGEAAALDVDEHVETVAHFSDFERTDHRGAVLVLGEVLFQGPAVDLDPAAALGEPDAGHRGLAAAGTPVVGLLRL